MGSLHKHSAGKFRQSPQGGAHGDEQAFIVLFSVDGNSGFYEQYIKYDNNCY